MVEPLKIPTMEGLVMEIMSAQSALDMDEPMIAHAEAHLSAALHIAIALKHGEQGAREQTVTADT